MNESETKVNNEIDVLIQKLPQILLKLNGKRIREEKLIEGLTDLRNMIEMVDIKESIVKQLKYTLILMRDNHDGNKHMLHTVIYGNPGTGKTTVCRILSKIWASLGIIKQIKKQEEKPPLLIPGEGLHREKSSLETRYKLSQIKSLMLKHQETATNLNRLIYRTPGVKDIEELSNKLSSEIDTIIEEIYNEKEEEEEFEPKIVFASRDTLIGQYAGKTALKTRAVLESARGGVLFIDEAYSLCFTSSGFKDKFGEECLAVINEFMSHFPNEIIIIFAGYKDKIVDNLFETQPGLKRRVWSFEIKDYTAEGLARIFVSQVNQSGWKIDSKIELSKIIGDNMALFSAGGGSMENLLLQCKLVYSDIMFDKIMTNDIDKTINDIVFLKAVETMKSNSDTEEDQEWRRLFI